MFLSLSNRVSVESAPRPQIVVQLGLEGAIGLVVIEASGHIG